MSKTLTVNNIPYEYPVAGENPGWGEAATDWATGVTDVLADLSGSNDIIETTTIILNNTSTFTNITSLSFNTGQVRGAEVQYSVYRKTDSATSGNAEFGVMYIIYDNNATAGSKWSLTAGPINGDAGVTFTITDIGQFQYKSTNMAGLNYSGVIHFRAKSLSQT